MPLCQKCNSEFPNRAFIEGKERNLQRRKYCLDCSPFGGHNTRPLCLSPLEIRTCPGCERELPPTFFYKRRNREGSSSYCKDCTTEQTIARQQKLKIRLVEYKGGKCVLCGYDRCLAALVFHHREPQGKDYRLSRHKTLAFETVVSEIDKCDLLCCRCHAEIHDAWNKEKRRMRFS